MAGLDKEGGGLSLYGLLCVSLRWRERKHVNFPSLERGTRLAGREARPQGQAANHAPKRAENRSTLTFMRRGVFRSRFPIQYSDRAR